MWEKLSKSETIINVYVEALAIQLSRLGWPQEKISETAGINQQRISQITNNTSFGNIGNLLSQGHDMEYIAKHYNMDLTLARASRLEGKTNQKNSTFKS